MNKYQNSIEVVDTLLHLMCGEEREDGYKPTMEEMSKSMDLLKELVDKETPIKLEETDVETDKDCFNWICPRCKSFHSESEGYQYCSECGQKLDWSDYER